MNRFHIVVANCNRAEIFAESFNLINGFDPSLDQVIVMDCSENPEAELMKLTSVSRSISEDAMHFFCRRNWNLNHGAQLDYIRLIVENQIDEPEIVFFLQDHYLNTSTLVNDDTIPDEFVIDLDSIHRLFHDNEVGCAYASRNGIRVSCISSWNNSKNIWGDNFDEIRDILQPRCFCVDGGNFFVKIQLYLNYFNNYKNRLFEGDGSYEFCHVWEVRLGSILYDQNILWFDLYNNVCFKNISELRSLEAQKKRVLSKIWVENRVWMFFYGQDLSFLWPFPFFKIVLQLLKIVCKKKWTLARKDAPAVKRFEGQSEP
ncbi:MAG: hypothetical protein JXQ96_04865 [Cyclobacteriaceae bacterium]